MSETINDWHAFFGLVGGGSANLMGLMFVAISVGHRSLTKNDISKIHTFATPALVHLAAVLVISAIVMSPGEISATRDELVLVGLVGDTYLMFYLLPNVKAAHKELKLPSDVLYVVAASPVVCYTMVAVGGFLLVEHTHAGMGLTAVGTVWLQLLSVRQAWQAVVTLGTRDEGN